MSLPDSRNNPFTGCPQTIEQEPTSSHFFASTTVKLLTMKLSTAAFFLFTLPRAIARPDEESASAPFVQRELAISHDGLDTKGRILLTMNHRDLGKVDVSSLESAQAAAKAFLEGTNDHGRRLGPFPNNGDKFNPKNKDPNHMRFVQEHNGMEIEGASIMVHTDANGNIVGINGEFVSTSKVSANR